MASSSVSLLHQILEEQAASRPSNVAIEDYPDVRMTYFELNDRSNRLARYLKSRRCQGEEVVALCLEKGHVLVVAILAILKAGMAWVPLPMDAPPARISHILKACNIELALCSEQTKHVVGDLISYLKVEDILESPQFRSYPGTNLVSEGEVTHLCHVLFTSGSTGVPKGVLIEHRAVMHNVRALVKSFELGTDTRTLQFAAPTFDVFGLDLFMTFACGGCLVLAPLSIIVADMTAFIHKTSITYTQLTPTILAMIDPAGVPSLRVLASSGEALPQILANQWTSKVRLFNAYGPTETIVCTVQELGEDQIDAACIGEALDGLEVCLLAEKSLEEVGKGEIGEICVAGPQLFRGYISTDKEVKVIECNRQGKRFYRTGDLGRVEKCPMGGTTIRYLGRRDGQVKLHGIRVDLSDVEQSILTCQMIQKCAVVLPKSGPSGGRLCSIVVLQNRFTSSQASNERIQQRQSLQPSVNVLRTSDDILQALQGANDAAITILPTHALPTSWWAVKELPLTSSGKIDRVKLRTWIENIDLKHYIDHLGKFVNKRRQEDNLLGEVEKQLKSLWAEILDRPVSSIDPTVSFIQLGADSLDAVRLMSKARHAGINLSLAQVYASRTIQELARSLQLSDHTSVAARAPAYRPFSSLPLSRPLAPVIMDAAVACGCGVAEIQDVYPCTEYQVGLMTLDLRCPGSYICAFSWTLIENLHVDGFRTAWAGLLAQEAVLRNRMIWDTTEQSFLQVTIRHDGIDWSKGYFEGPMSIGDSLCRGFLEWHNKEQRWKFHLKIHHSIIDGWSLRLMLNKLKAIYFAESAPSSEEISFAGFIQHRVEENRHKEPACKQFWHKYFDGFCQQDFPPSPSDPHHEVHATQRHSKQVAISLQETATRFGVTSATILYAAVALVIGAHADSQDIVFGLILAGRESPLDGVFDMIGPAFASFPFRTRIDNSLTMASFLQAIERNILEVIPYQSYGLQRIQQCGKGAANACDFGCLVVVQPEDENLAGEGLWEEVHGQTTGLADSMPLSFELVLGADKVRMNCNADPAYVSGGDVDILLSQLDTVLQHLSSSTPDLVVSQVRLASKDEQARFLDWASAYGDPVNACLHELFQTSVSRHPDRVAIDDQASGQLTYRELDAYSSSLSNFLQSRLTIERDTIIPMAFERSALAIVAILAVLKAGGACVPIDASWPAGRVQYILNETQATVFLCSSEYAPVFRGLSEAVTMIAITEDCWERKDDVGIGGTAGPDHMISFQADADADTDNASRLAFVMFTSGSTGQPKGVMLEHRALSTSLTHLAQDFALSPGNRHLQFSAFVYDVSLSDIFIPLLSGACICVPTAENRLNRLSLTMKEMAIESAILTPSVADLISPEDGFALQALMTGGEMTKKSLIQKWSHRTRLFNAYGPTEASITTAVTEPLSPDADTSNIGRNVTAWHWIVRRDLNGEIYPAPMGCSGEIALAGHSLARGYLNNPAMTKKHFVNAPHLTAASMPNRVYLTGDIGRYAADGTIRIMGRTDRMLKVNGVRVEPGESEQQLRQQGGLFTSCVVQCVSDNQGITKLAAFIEMVSFEPADSRPLNDRCIAVEECTRVFKNLCYDAQTRLKESLPRQYVPTLFIPIRRIPYTASDKADLKRLRDELQEILDISQVFSVGGQLEEEAVGTPPTTPSEIALEAAFRQVFAQKQPLHNAADFFKQGGDSLSAIKLVSAARSFGLEISVQQVYRHPLLKDLAAVAIAWHAGPTRPIKDALSISDDLRKEVIQQCHIPLGEIEDILPASTFQEGLAAIFVGDHMPSGHQKDAAYNAVMTFELAKDVDAARLDAAIQVVVSKNPIWRTTIVHTSEGAMQVIRRHYSAYSRDSQESPLFRYWIQEEATSHLVFSIHHILYDAWTIQRLLDDVNHNYSHPKSTRPAALPYRKFIEHLRAMKSDDAGKFWERELENTSLALFPQLPRLDHRARATESLSHKNFLDLRRIRVEGISAATLVFTALGVLLSAYCGTDDVCYGTTLSGRDTPDLEDIAGPTISTVPMRVKISRDDTVATLLAKTQESLLNMRQHQHYGLHNIAHLHGAGARNACQFRTILVVQQLPKQSGGENDERAVRDLISERTSMFVNYPLVIIAEIQVSSGNIVLRVEYDPECLQKEQVTRFVQQLDQTMNQCANPTRIVGELELITTADQLDIQAQNRELRPSSKQYLHQIFESVAAQLPTNLAVDARFQNTSLSYSQLNEHATRLAKNLHSYGSVFGLCFQKSPLMVIAMLAVWKAGRAFATLDPAAPPARLRSILTDLGTNCLVLTESSQTQLFEPSTFIPLDSAIPILVQQLTTVGGAPSATEEEQKTPRTAYIFYTSGSSGTPKGVVVSHSSIATSLLDAASVMGLNQQTRMLQYAAFTFDTSILEIFGTLISGGCLCMVSESQRLAVNLAEAAQQLRITQAILTPTVAQFLEPKSMSKLKSLMLVGEPPSRHFLQEWASQNPAVQIMNGYGPTEASVHSSTNLHLHEKDPHNIGYATACSMFITVPENVNRLAPIGTIGELIICGNTLADGYLNKPDITSQAFGAYPIWCNGTNIRYYKTGDLAQYAPDLSIIYLGRKDLQVKIHGQRIELPEIEHQIMQYGVFPGCVVDVISSELLVAFLVVDAPLKIGYEGPLPPEALPQTESDKLRVFLSSVLPAFMVPAIYVPVAVLPTTSSGKADRRLLLASAEAVIDSYRCGSNTFKRPAETNSEKLLAQLWAETIAIPRDLISLDDTILSLGGDSVTVIRIIAGARRRHFNLDIGRAYHHETLESMAKLLESNQSKKQTLLDPPTRFSLIKDLDQDTCVSVAAEQCDVAKYAILDVYPCTAMQESLMISSTKAPGAFFDQETFQLSAGTSKAKLISALQAVWARHDILRARIILDQEYRSLQVVIDETLNVQCFTQHNIEDFLRKDAASAPGYGERLSRCSILTCGSQIYLIISQHHAAFDGWSTSLLLAEIEREYLGEPVSKSPNEIFPSFIRHVTQLRKSSRAEEYWKNHLLESNVTLLPQTKSSSAFEANQKHVEEFSFRLGGIHSLATMVEAAWGLLLSQYTDTEDISFGTVRSGRSVPVDGVDEMVGPTIVTVPRRLHIAREQNMVEYLQNVDATIIEALPWEQYGHQNIRKLGQGPRNACQFSSMIVVQMSSSKSEGEKSKIFIPKICEEGHLQHDCLTVVCEPQDKDVLKISFTYDDRKISPEDVRWMSYHLQHLLSEINVKGEKILRELDVCGTKGILQVQQWNSTPIVPCKKRVDEIFVERADQWPLLTAVNASDATLTYREMDKLSSKLASKLRSLGVQKNDAIPLYMTKSAMMVITMVALLKAGAAYVPLGTDLPQERIRLLLRDLRADIVICTPDQAPKLAGLSVKSLCYEIEGLWTDTAPDTQPTENREKAHKVSRNEEELAYIIYTSGSSGKPKGVLIDHTALATTILANGQYMGYEKGTKTLSFAAYTFDVNVMEVWLTLLHGGCLCIPSEDQRLGNLSGYINDNDIELAFLTPTAVRNLLRTPSQVPSLKTLRSGGEPLPHTLLQQWSTELRLINSYGPTEACVDACRNAKVTPSTDPNNIGYPNATHLWVVEPGNHNQLVPIGCTGELLISGPTLALGYLNDEDKTRKAFIDGSSFTWALHGENRFYATGDIVRQNSDGSINYIGRQDLQTKINGFRIELQEIEHAIERCNGIGAALVDKVNLQEKDSEFLIAFFTFGSAPTASRQEKLLPATDKVRSIIRDIGQRISRALPPYMVPQYYLPIDKIPLTTSGKVDRKLLQRIFHDCSPDHLISYRSKKKSQKLGPRTTTGKILQGLWAQALSLDPSHIDLDSQFVALGGDSLTAIKLATMCREIGFQLSIVDILGSPRFEDMMKVLEKGRVSPFSHSHTAAPQKIASSVHNGAYRNPEAIAQIAAACELDISQIEDTYPCTPMQEALIAVTARVPEAYIAYELFQLPLGIDLQRFQVAWKLVYSSNPILRTRICSVTTAQGFENMQVVCKTSCELLETSDKGSSCLPTMGMGTSLIQFRIIRSSDGCQFEILKHHAVFDGFSMKLLWDDLQFAFEHLNPPPPRPLFRNYASYLYSLPEEETINFWKGNLEGFRGEHFPVLPNAEFTPRATSQSCKTIETRVKWNDDCQFTFATVARAAWAVILSLRNKSNDFTREVCFAVTNSGRSEPLNGIENMAGPTITTVPVRVDLDPEKSMGQFLQMIHEQAISMLPFEYYGLSKIQAVSESARAVCKAPNLLVIQPPQLHDEILPAGIVRIPHEGEGMIELFGLVVECMQSSAQDSMSLSASFDPSLMREGEALYMLQQLSWMITKLNKNSTSSFTMRSAIWELAREHDFQRMLDWNSTPQASQNLCLHELVEASASTHPRHLAVDAHDGKLTYTELNTSANTLASILVHKHDVKPGDLIPICFEKSKDMVVAILGVLKAGAAYVPLDIGHPSSRVDYIVNEVKARVVLVSSQQAETFTFSVETLKLGSEMLLASQKATKQGTANSKDVAYVIFTSGSTGHPKGVVTEHGAASLSVLEHGKRYQHDRRGTKTRALQFSSYTFDASVLDIFAVMAYGGCVCIPSEQERMNDLENVLRSMKINFADLTPTVANLLDPSALPFLMSLAIGGEMVNRTLISKWSAREPSLEVFVNSYGPTEVAIGCALGEVNLEKPVGYIGKRVGGSLWIVDKDYHDQLVPISSVGELVVTGATLARGYLNDSAKTSAAFIRGVPWLSRTVDEVMYKTGDIARFDEDGNVEILGRKEDGQIKLNGLRLELGEIESAIEGCHCLSAAQHVAAAKIDLGGKPILVAFVQLPETFKSPTKTIFGQPSEEFGRLVSKAADELRSQLPEYMIPRLWLPVSKWPLNSSGKTDRKLLAAACKSMNSASIMRYQQSRRTEIDDDDATSKTVTEKIIETAWRQVLKKDKELEIAPNDDFFKLGGDSLSTIMLIPALKAVGISIHAHEIFATKTLRIMGRLIDSNKTIKRLKEDSLKSNSSKDTTDDHDNSSSGAMTPSSCQLSLRSKELNITNEDIVSFLASQYGVEEVYPASYTQLTFLIEGLKWCRSYYAWFFIDVGPSASIAQIQDACNVVTKHHPILKTSFHLINRRCYQAVRKELPEFKVLFFNTDPSVMCAQLDKDVQYAVGFGEIPTKFRLMIDTKSGRRFLALGLSHAQYDGFSLPTILTDLGLAYLRKLPTTRTSPSYRRFIDYTLQLCNEETRIFWRELLEGSSMTTIVRVSSSYFRPVMRQSIKRIIPFEFKHTGVFSYPIMLKAAWAITLACLSKAKDVTFGNVVSGRFAAFEGAQNVVGPCLNFLPVRVRLSANQSFSQLLQQLQEEQVAAIPFECTPFDFVAAQAPWPPGTQLDSIFQFQNIPDAEDHDSMDPEWKVAGNSVYGGGLLQSGSCWLMAWPQTESSAQFRFTYSEDTLEMERAEMVLDLFFEILRKLNDDLSESVAYALAVSTTYEPGKKDRREEPRQEHSALQPSISQEYLQPYAATVTEHLASIWRTVLQILEISLDDSFFEIGGDSIAAAEVAALSTDQGFCIRLQDVIDFPTLRSQTSLITGEIDRRKHEENGVKLHFSKDHKFN